MTATIRPIRPTDFAHLFGFRQQAALNEITAHSWPKIQPESPRFPVVRLLSQSVAPPSGARAWARWDNRRVTGVIVGHPRCSGAVWDVQHLYGDDDDAGAELLDHLAARAGQRGALRLFLQTPIDGPGAVVARKAGYDRYTRERLYRLSPPFDAKGANPFPARPRLRSDEHGVFHLYCAAVPAAVRAAEAMTREEWVALYRGRRRWRPALIGDRQQYVWEYGDSIVGWLEIVYGAKSQFLDLLIHPEHDRLMDGIVRYALSQTSSKAPVYATARVYQETLASGLEREGFLLVDDSDLFVRQLAARRVERALVPANLISG